MPTQADVYRIADRLHAAGVRVSLRNVIPKLPYGGSNRVVGPILRDWKADRVYRPGLVTKGLPEQVQNSLAKAVSELWTAAQEEAARGLAEERDRVGAKELATEAVLQEALARLDAAREEIVRLRGEVTRLEASLANR